MLSKQYEFKREIKKLQIDGKKVEALISFQVGDIATGDFITVRATKLTEAIKLLQDFTKGRLYTVDIEGHMYVGGELVTGEVMAGSISESYGLDIMPIGDRSEYLTGEEYFNKRYVSQVK